MNLQTCLLCRALAIQTALGFNHELCRLCGHMYVPNAMKDKRKSIHQSHTRKGNILGVPTIGRLSGGNNTKGTPIAPVQT